MNASIQANSYGLKPIVLSEAFIRRCQSFQAPLVKEVGSKNINLLPFITEMEALLDNNYSKIQLTYKAPTEKQTHILCQVNLDAITIKEKKSIKCRLSIFDLRTQTLTINNCPANRSMKGKFLARVQWFINQIENPKMNVDGIIAGDANGRN